MAHIYIKYKSCTIYRYILTQNLFSENVQHVIPNKLNQNKVLKSPDKFAFHCQLLKVFFCFLDLINAVNPNSQSHEDLKGRKISFQAECQIQIFY